MLMAIMKTMWVKLLVNSSCEKVLHPIHNFMPYQSLFQNLFASKNSGSIGGSISDPEAIGHTLTSSIIRHITPQPLPRNTPQTNPNCRYSKCALNYEASGMDFKCKSYIAGHWTTIERNMHDTTQLRVTMISAHAYSIYPAEVCSHGEPVFDKENASYNTIYHSSSVFHKYLVIYKLFPCFSCRK